nr:hypothetical protein GCM10010200_059160 [Actinomadura rugatobispora]
MCDSAPERTERSTATAPARSPIRLIPLRARGSGWGRSPVAAQVISIGERRLPGATRDETAGTKALLSDLRVSRPRLRRGVPWPLNAVLYANDWRGSWWRGRGG